jgi:hypothetical protein
MPLRSLSTAQLGAVAGGGLVVGTLATSSISWGGGVGDALINAPTPKD